MTRAAGLSLLFLAGLRAGFSAGGPGHAGADLRKAILSQGEARVIVTLLPERDMPLTRSRRSPRQRVEEVLRGVPAHEIRDPRPLSAAPVFAARITGRGLAVLLADPRVSRVDLDGEVRGADAGSAAQIQSDRVRQLGYSGEGITVAVLDSGTDLFENPDLDPVVIGEECFCSNRGGCCPDGTSRQSGPGSTRSIGSHGPGILGILASQGAIAPEGIAPGARMLVLRVLDDSAVGTFFDVLAALDWIATDAPQVRLVNLSLSAGTYPSPCDHIDSFSEAVSLLSAALRQRGCLLIAASGNTSSTDLIGTPACVDSVLSVGAVNSADQIPFYSNSGEGLDLLAPGQNIVTSSSIARVQTLSGTSVAVPHVTAGAALLLEANPALSPEDLEQRFETRGVPISDDRNGRITPRLDVYRALLLPLDVVAQPSVASLKSRGPLHLVLQPRAGQLSGDLVAASVVASAGGGEAAADPSSAVLGDANADGIADLTVAVDRQELLEGISGTGEVRLTVTAAFASGIEARGATTLRIVGSREAHPAEPSP
ncbi:MAG TPA: S8 family serine peptidase [Candidatus Polarisedimenticolia bacterium]|nr:S8 family serine peptidase [Candidatus Polarisedimenticolia bacterium]